MGLRSLPCRSLLSLVLFTSSTPDRDDPFVLQFENVVSVMVTDCWAAMVAVRIDVDDDDEKEVKEQELMERDPDWPTEINEFEKEET
ncbi:hypothetical protein BLNAU_21814 [Blattamonas nauphoetae]|uniref:Secreted protein n=1 Tax=Blattamonas nauphoetae TaxID=2049346 RepID=A0ABQ9WUX4_9EUKA|nr:hypothetical protein BLNAU_21814 [Blattamonas nauphoetae]